MIIGGSWTARTAAVAERSYRDAKKLIARLPKLGAPETQSEKFY